MYSPPTDPTRDFNRLANAGDCAVNTLLRILRDELGAGASPASPDRLNIAVSSVFALGEAAVSPSGEAIALLAEVLTAWQGRLLSAIQENEPPQMQAEGPVVSAIATWHRAVAACVQALSVVAEHTANRDEELALRIAHLLLPLTLEPDPLAAIPDRAFQPANAFWVSEHAAIGLLRLASGTAGAETRGRVVTNECHAEFGDQRTVQGLCLLALQRSEACGKARLRRLLEPCAEQWAALHDAAQKPHSFETEATGFADAAPTGWHHVA